MKEEGKEEIPVSLDQLEKLDKQVSTWQKLAEVVATARDQLRGEDLGLFNRIVGTAPRDEVQALIQKWKHDKLSTLNRLSQVDAKPFDTPSWNNHDEDMEES